MGGKWEMGGRVTGRRRPGTDRAPSSRHYREDRARHYTHTLHTYGPSAANAGPWRPASQGL
eukprot:scaffold4771_cov129-Isochrysis_galbana.AAC.3